MKEKRQLIAKMKKLYEEVHKLELRVVVLKAMLQSGEVELERRKVVEGDSVPLIVGE